MRRHPKDTLHPIACGCLACAAPACRNRRIDVAIKAITRALFLIAALLLIPFIIAHALASTKGNNL